MKYICFGEWSLYLIFPFLIPVFSYLRGLIEENFAFVTPNDSHPFFISFLTILSNIFLGIPFLIYQCFNRKSNQEHQTGFFLSIFSMKKIKDSEEGKQKTKIYLVIVLCVVLTAINFPLFYIINYSTNNPLIIYKTNISLVFFMFICAYFFLSMSVYRHHYFSLIFILISTIITGFTDLFNLKWNILLLCGLVNLLCSIYLTLEKWLMEFKLLNPYQLLFYLGCCGLCLYVILFIVLYFLSCTPEYLFCDSNSGGSVENIILLLGSLGIIDYLVCIAYIIVFGLYMLFCFLTLYYLTPIHYCISEVITMIFCWIINFANGITEELWYISLIGYIIMFFAALVCNEMIIVKVCGLEYNTKQEIKQRSLSTENMLNKIELANELYLDIV